MKIIRERQRTAVPVRIIPRGGVQEKISKKFHSTENEPFSPLPIFIHGTEICSILIHWTELYPILKHWAELHPILIHWIELHLILIHWVDQYPTLIHYRTLPYLNTLPNYTHLNTLLKYLFTWHSVTTVSAGVIISPRRNYYPRGDPGIGSKKFSRKSLTVPKIAAQCRKRVIPYLYILKRTIACTYTLPNAIAYLDTCIHYLNTCITYSNTLLAYTLQVKTPATFCIITCAGG